MTKRVKLHLYIIISCLIIVIAAAMGTVFHFTSNGFFNYGVENSSGASVSVTYSAVTYSQSDVEETCEAAFSTQGLSGYTVKSSEAYCQIEYVFSHGTDTALLQSAVDLINRELKSGSANESEINLASWHVYEAEAGNASIYIWGAVAAAIAIAVQAVYVAIRYKLTMGAVSLVSSLNAVLLLISLFAITRIPFGTYAVAVIALLVLADMICQQLYLSRVNSALKDEEKADLSIDELASQAAAENLKGTNALCGSIAVICAVYAVVIAIVSFSLSAIAAALAGIVACAVCWFTTALFTPCLYARVGRRSKKSGAKKEKKSQKAEKAVAADSENK